MDRIVIFNIHKDITDIVWFFLRQFRVMNMCLPYTQFDEHVSALHSVWQFW